MIDTHSHINMIEGLSLDEIIKNAFDNGIDKIIVPSAYPADMENIMDLVNKYDNVYGMLGIHPSEVKSWDDSFIEKIKNYAKNSKIAAIGEIGLDYYWDKSLMICKKKYL